MLEEDLEVFYLDALDISTPKHVWLFAKIFVRRYFLCEAFVGKMIEGKFAGNSDLKKGRCRLSSHICDTNSRKKTLEILAI